MRHSSGPSCLRSEAIKICGLGTREDIDRHAAACPVSRFSGFTPQQCVATPVLSHCRAKLAHWDFYVHLCKDLLFVFPFIFPLISFLNLGHLAEPTSTFTYPVLSPSALPDSGWRMFKCHRCLLSNMCQYQSLDWKNVSSTMKLHTRKKNWYKGHVGNYTLYNSLISIWYNFNIS